MWKRLKRDQSGMTLIELLTAELIGGIVITAAIMLVMSSLNSSQRVSDRVNSISQGRILAAQIEQRVGSQVCLYSGEYAINGATNYTGAADSIIYAGPTNLTFFADINKNGVTSSTSSVGFTPYIRFLYFQLPTGGVGAERKGAIYDGYRAPSNSSLPFSYNLSPLSGANALDQMKYAAPSTVMPTTTRPIVQGVTNATTGAVGTTPVPFFQYWNTNDVLITGAGGVVPTPQLGDIGHVRVNFKILAESGNDSARGNTNLDKRTASFSSDIYLRTNPSICG